MKGYGVTVTGRRVAYPLVAIPRPGHLGYYPGMSGVTEELVAGLASAWNAHDSDAYAALFHEDGTFVNVNGSYEKSREEIRKLHETIHASFYKDSVMRGEVLDARELVPGVIVTHVSHELEGDARFPDQTVRTLATYVIEQRAGIWKFIAAHNTRVVPPR
jgi:uncharacterized protein (TIGR02246 family)